MARKKKTGSETFQNFTPYKPKKGEEYMGEPQREHFKSILIDWKSKLMQEVDRTVSHMKDEAANFPDPADRATQEEEFSLELRARDRERARMKVLMACGHYLSPCACVQRKKPLGKSSQGAGELPGER